MKDELITKWQGVVHRGIRWSASSSILLQIFSLAKAIVIGRVLGAEAIGIYALLQIAANFGSRFSDFGLSNSVIHYRCLSREQLGGLYIVNVLGGFIVALTTVIVGAWLAPMLAEYLPYIGITILLKSLAQQFQYLLQRDLKYKAISLVEVLSVGLGELLCIVLLLNQFGLWAIVWGILFTAIIYFVGFWKIGIKEFGVPKIFQASFKEFRKLFHWGLYQMGEGLLGYWGQRADRVILASFAGLEFLGFYTLAIQLITKPYRFVGSITSRVFQPIYSKLSTNIDEINQVYINNTKAISSILFPIYAFIGLQANLVIEVLYGSNWEPVVPLLQALCVLGAAKSIYVNIGSYLLGIGKPNLGFSLNIYNSLLAIAAISLGLYFFSPTEGIIIYAVGVSIFALPADLYVRQKGSRMPIRSFINVLLRITLATIFGVSITQMIEYFSGIDGTYKPLLSAIAFITITSLFVYYMVYNGSTREIRKTMWFNNKNETS